MDQQPYRAFRSDAPAQDTPAASRAGTAAPAESPHEAIEAAVDQLRGRAFLYDDPDAYTAGVRDVLSELDARVDARFEPPPMTPRAGEQ